MKRLPMFKAALLGLVISILVAGATVIEVWLDYRDSEKRSYATALDITRVVERQTRDTVFYVGETLNETISLVQEAHSEAELRNAARSSVLQSYCKTLIGCKTIMAIGPDGHVVLEAPVEKNRRHNVADSAYFSHALSGNVPYIDPAAMSNLRGFPILFKVSKAAYDNQGKLIAVVVIGMETRQLTSFYSLFGFSVAPAVAIYKRDGGLVARHPGMDKYIGRNNASSRIFTTLLPQAPAGVFDSVSPIDGKSRLAAYRSLPDLDLVIFAGIEKTVAFAPWQTRTLRLSTIVAVMLGLIWGALLLAYRAISVQLQLREQNLQLDDLVTKDPLTGIGNRRLFDRTLKRDWSKHKRSGAPLSVVMIDVDCFKNFNDYYGHVAGDGCLQQVARVIRHCLHREGDLVARYGGEEFVALLECGNEGARLIAEKMRQCIEDLNIPHTHSAGRSIVTASFGIASTDRSEFDTAADLLTAADRALYDAKAGGRNRVVNCETAIRTDAEKRRA